MVIIDIPDKVIKEAVHTYLRGVDISKIVSDAVSLQNPDSSYVERLIIPLKNRDQFNFEECCQKYISFLKKTNMVIEQGKENEVDYSIELLLNKPLKVVDFVNQINTNRFNEDPVYRVALSDSGIRTLYLNNFFGGFHIGETDKDVISRTTQNIEALTALVDNVSPSIKLYARDTYGHLKEKHSIVIKQMVD
jgi:hypothetical protein